MKTQAELLPLLSRLLALPAETEWLEFKEAKENFDFTKLGKYFSALSNEANLNRQSAGWLIFGINTHHQVVGSNYRPDRAQLDKLKKEIADKTSGRLTFTEIHEVQHPQGRVVMFEIPPTPTGIPTAWEGHFYGRENESLSPLSLSELERIRHPARPDWSAQTIADATLDDLLPEAILKARQQYQEKHPHLTEQVDSWNDTIFLNKAKITIAGRITNTAILLLGRPESVHWLSPAQAQMTWVLKDTQGNDRDYQHFSPPFLLNTDALFAKVRNLTYRYLRENTLLPTEVSQYDSWVIRELLHNCIAHQDYTLGGRINVVEQEDSLLFTNMGKFLPDSVEWVIEHDSPPDQYRNPFLAHAMVELKMIDTIGSGIRRVFNKQRERFFPLPDYDLHDPQRVRVRLYGKILNENYTRALLNNTDLLLHEVVALDCLQKGQALTDEQFRLLKHRKLVEGRRPNLYVAAAVAQATEGKAAYIRHRAFDKVYYKSLVIQYLREWKEAAPADIERLLLDKLPDVLEYAQKKNRIRNLLQEMTKEKTIMNQGGKGGNAKWVLQN
ncbi:RNA-binding domain-containing protein [Thiothrix subterranea]|uniref:DNA binding domain-containing protein n=1 Tax=Thiothrix subterranea TaxID=2735563 RepID=A0AA51R063_9GAMM|nr:RNA-binding domain-containing protein [Thiothrix subterranea]WML87682.1 putative DNA binding domain-containing protein [Thiothrix subterranea]